MEFEVELEEIELMGFKEASCIGDNRPRVITEEEIDVARIMRTAPKERLSAQAAIWQAFNSGIFTMDDDVNVEGKPYVRKTNKIEMHQIRSGRGN